MRLSNFNLVSFSIWKFIHIEIKPKNKFENVENFEEEKISYTLHWIFIIIFIHRP